MKDLKQQFIDEQNYKKDALSKRAAGKEAVDPNSMTLQRQERLKKLEMDENMINQEEAFFQKWLKQRENLGDEANNTSVSA